MGSSTGGIGVGGDGNHHHWMGSRRSTVGYELAGMSLHVHGPWMRLRGNCSIMMLQ